MKKINFLIKLNKDGKLQTAAPSEPIRDSYMAKSDSNLVSAKILLNNGRLEESVSLAYYSMYHMLTALLFRVGIKCENHAAAIILLKTVFGIDNGDISFAKDERIDKQYYADFHIAKEDVAEAIVAAEEFDKKLLDFISRLDNKQMGEYRKKFQALI